MPAPSTAAPSIASSSHNGKLWLALAGVRRRCRSWRCIGRRRRPCSTPSTSALADWLLAAAIASSTLLLEEGRKLGMRVIQPLLARRA